MQRVQKARPDPEPYTGIYAMHKYWSKKPFNVVRSYIKEYSRPGEIVLDPFCGSGISNTESLVLGRRTIGIDINPMAVFITGQMIYGLDTKKARAEFARLQDRCMNRVHSLYPVYRNGAQHTGSHYIYKDGKMAEIWCKHGGKKLVFRPLKRDVEHAGSFAYDSIDLPHPRGRMPENSRINVRRGMRVYELFTPRNLLALSMLMEGIRAVREKRMCDFFRFCFTASVGQASRMVFVVRRRGRLSGARTQGRKEVGSWVIGYWVPRNNFEINVWNCFEHRYSRIIRAKEGQHSAVPQARCSMGGMLGGSGNALLLNADCYRTLSSMPGGSVDYIITDPPHGDRLPYMELSAMWNGWMGSSADAEEELVISDSPERDKTPAAYNAQMARILSEAERVLRPGRHLTIMFNNMDAGTWEGLQRVLFGLRLELAGVDVLGYSAASVVQDSRKGGLKTDFVFTFKKTGRRGRSPREVPGMADSAIRDYVRENPGCKRYEALNHAVKQMMKKRALFDIAKMARLAASLEVIPGGGREDPDSARPPG